MYDIIIIGAGTAGMTSAIYGARNNHKTLLLESQVPGGQIINSPDIENYPGIESIHGYDYSMGMKAQAEKLGAIYKRETVNSVKFDGKIKEVFTNKDTYQSKTIIIATGGKPRELEVKGEKELIGKGVSYCATCDGNFFRNKEVVVVGGGNTALEDALFLSNICSKVYLIHRRQGFRADENNITSIEKKKNIHLILDSVVDEVIGSESVERITVKNLLTNKISEIPSSAIFIAVGQIPQSQLFKDHIKIDSNGYAVVGEDCKTEIAGIFIAGDIRVKPLRQLVTASSDGATAAIAASSYLNKT